MKRNEKNRIYIPWSRQSDRRHGKALADEYAVARAVFEEVDDALGEKLSDIMWNGPAETLTLTRNAQPALMATSIAAFRVLEERGLVLADKVSYVAGHSLGEYSALAASGALSLSDTLACFGSVVTPCNRLFLSARAQWLRSSAWISMM